MPLPVSLGKGTLDLGYRTVRPYRLGNSITARGPLSVNSSARADKMLELGVQGQMSGPGQRVEILLARHSQAHLLFLVPADT
jgi:hypothetical protein